MKLGGVSIQAVFSVAGVRNKKFVKMTYIIPYSLRIVAVTKNALTSSQSLLSSCHGSQTTLQASGHQQSRGRGQGMRGFATSYYCTIAGRAIPPAWCAISSAVQDCDWRICCWNRVLFDSLLTHSYIQETFFIERTCLNARITVSSEQRNNVSVQ